MSEIIGYAVDTIEMPSWHRYQLKNKDGETIEKWQQLPYDIFSSILLGQPTQDPFDRSLTYVGIYDKFNNQFVTDENPNHTLGMFGYLGYSKQPDQED